MVENRIIICNSNRLAQLNAMCTPYTVNLCALHINELRNYFHKMSNNFRSATKSLPSLFDLGFYR